MNKREIFNHYAAILDDVLSTSMYFDTYFQRPWFLDGPINGQDCAELPSNFCIRDGATRACLVDDTYDWVVKFDINDDENGSACKRELAIFARAQDQSLDQYFCKPIYIGTYTKKITFYDINDIERNCDWCGYDPDEFDEEIMAHEDDMIFKEIIISIPLYAYPRANCYCYDDLDESLISSAQKICSPLREENIAVATAFIQEYGFEEYEAISQFALENNINDIHMANVGEINGCFVIIDYAGYYSSCK